MDKTVEVSQAARELLPCPFCGGEPSVSTYETESLWSHNIVTYTQVGCGECDYSFASEPGYETEAPHRWNIRATQPEAALREADAALKPFADVADEYDDADDDHHEVWMDAGPQRLIRASFKLEHYRRARAARAALKDHRHG